MTENMARLRRTEVENEYLTVACKWTEISFRLGPSLIGLVLVVLIAPRAPRAPASAWRTAQN